MNYSKNFLDFRDEFQAISGFFITLYNSNHQKKLQYLKKQKKISAKFKIIDMKKLPNSRQELYDIKKGVQ